MKRDLRAYARQTRFRLIIGALAIIFLVGEGLIYWRYGTAAAISGLLCLGAAILPIVLTVIALQVIDWIVKRTRPEE